MGYPGKKRRKKLSNKQASRTFKKGNKVNRKNNGSAMRGGIRL